jgi:MSHA biogenesis protein MshO
MKRCSLPRGFTLVEAVIVIAITSIIAVTVAVFIQKPVQGYFDTVRRAELTTGSGAVAYLEFLQTSGGGRYRASPDNTGGGNVLDFTQANTKFDVLGPAVATVAGELNLAVVYNQGVSGADAYRGDNTSAISAIAGNTVTIASKQFPFASPASRFQIISYPVTYVCDPGAQTLTRYWNYPIAAVQPTSFAAGTASSLLAKNVTSCAFSYSANVISQRAGVVGASLQISQSNESVNLYDEVHVSNVP